MKTLKLFLIIILSLLIFLFLTGAFKLNISNKIYNLYTDKLDKELRIVHISDLHSCLYGDKQKDLISNVNSLKPDLIVLTGDIIDDRLEMDNALVFLSYIGLNYDSYYVTGNHEYRTKSIMNIKSILENNSITVLDGFNKIVETNGNTINLSGIDDFSIGYDATIKQLESIKDNQDSKLISILLAHRPEHINLYLNYNFDLVLSGHAHGGQWIIPGLLNGFLAPNQGFFPKYAGGLYKHDKTYHIISRGLAKESTRFVPRIYNPPEVNLIIINPN